MFLLISVFNFFGEIPDNYKGMIRTFAGPREHRNGLSAPTERNGQNARFLPTGRERIREPLSAGKTAQHSKDAKRMLAFLAVSVNHEQESGRKTKHEMNNQND